MSLIHNQSYVFSGKIKQIYTHKTNKLLTETEINHAASGQARGLRAEPLTGFYYYHAD